MIKRILSCHLNKTPIYKKVRIIPFFHTIVLIWFGVGAPTTRLKCLYSSRENDRYMIVTQERGKELVHVECRFDFVKIFWRFDEKTLHHLFTIYSSDSRDHPSPFFYHQWRLSWSSYRRMWSLEQNRRPVGTRTVGRGLCNVMTEPRLSSTKFYAILDNSRK